MIAPSAGLPSNPMASATTSQPTNIWNSILGIDSAEAKAPTYKKYDPANPMIQNGQKWVAPLDWVHSLPGGQSLTRVDFANSLPGNDDGFVSYRHPENLTVLKGLDAQEFKIVLSHELAHTIAYQIPSRPDLKAPFGKGPFVTPYAKKNAEEDFAETYMSYVLKTPMGKEFDPKIAALKDILNQVSKK